MIYTLHDTGGRYICTFSRDGGHGLVSLKYRDLLAPVLANGAGGIVLFHNHPSGDPTPSASDVEATRALAALCRPLEITIHDHLVVAGGSVVSMRRSGLLEPLEMMR